MRRALFLVVLLAPAPSLAATSLLPVWCEDFDLGYYGNLSALAVSDDGATFGFAYRNWDGRPGGWRE